MYARASFDEYTVGSIVSVVRRSYPEASSLLEINIDFSDSPASLFRFVFASNKILILVPQDFSSSERRDFFVNRCIACLDLFLQYKITHPERNGVLDLWVDDLPMGPGLAFCGNNPSSILIPDSAFFETHGYKELRDLCDSEEALWRDRLSTCFWRGSSTGLRQPGQTSIRDLQRVKLCNTIAMSKYSCHFDIGLSSFVQIHSDEEIEYLKSLDVLRPSCSLQTFRRYKLSIDIDGNTCSWPGLFTKILMGNVILKIDSPKGWRQWYYDMLIPWKNFIPVSDHMGELGHLVHSLIVNDRFAETVSIEAVKLGAALSYDNVMDESMKRIDQVLDYDEFGRISTIKMFKE